jgi:hypothetical protein
MPGLPLKILTILYWTQIKFRKFKRNCCSFTYLPASLIKKHEKNINRGNFRHKFLLNIFPPLFCHFWTNSAIFLPPIFPAKKYFLGPFVSYLAENSAIWQQFNLVRDSFKYIREDGTYSTVWSQRFYTLFIKISYRNCLVGIVAFCVRILDHCTNILYTHIFVLKWPMNLWCELKRNIFVFLNVFINIIRSLIHMYCKYM